MELPKRYDAKESEKKWQEYWEKNSINKFNSDSTAEIYSIDTPPPTISGNIHMGHAFSYSHTDFIVRFQRMNGKNVFYPFGFDDNGLATERLVEKEKKIKAQAMDRDKFIKICLEVSKKYEDRFKIFWSNMGISCDWSLEYSTINERSRRISQKSFIELYKKGREYRKDAPVMWCPECQTAIAQVELKDQDISSNFNDIVFKLKNGDDLIIATTRPELLPSCVAVFAHPDDKRYTDLFGKKATVPLFDYEVPILPDKRADPEKGTGIVMCCTFGDQTDMEWYFAHNLPLRISITRDGKMNELAGRYKGMSILTARKMMIEDLKDQRLLLTQTPITHAVNCHERCGTEIEIIPSKQWFIKYLDLKDEFIKQGAKLNWYPKHMKVRYDHWIEGLQWDWLISRQRFFGIPFPVWYCAKCEEVILADEKDLPVDPLKDKPPVKKCPKCSHDKIIPEKDVLDTWATSSLSPQINARWGEKDDIMDKVYPMSLRPQAHDIITFWLFNTVVKSYLHNKSLPWKDVMISGHGLDPHGKKMSKSKGNIVDPIETLKRFSADSLRFWAAGSKLGDDLPFQEKDLVTAEKMTTKLWNASKFSIMHLQDYDLENPKKLEIIDRWLLSKLHRIIKASTDSFNKYEYYRTKADVENFFWHTFCDNYLEIVKDRLYNPDKRGKEQRISAQYGLYHGQLSILKLIAPIMPYISEEIYQLYFAEKENKKSIHISAWPEFNNKFIDEEAEKLGDIIIYAVEHSRRAKADMNISLKTPVKKLMIKSKISQQEFDMIKDDIISATNAEDLLFERLDDKSEIDIEHDIVL
ncbi:MAG: valine--tRNA ligase [Candidatus Woesearchaeota archaeon]